MELTEQDLQKYFYQQEQSCPVCAEKFPATKVRKSMCAVDRRDTDFYNHCAPVDPNAYSVWVCPQCGYAASDANFTQVTPVEKGLLQKALAGRRGPPNLTGQRDTALALRAMEQALFCAQARQGKPSMLAGLYLKTAWVLRAANDPTETAYLEQALENYRQAYQSEALPLGKMSELTLTYLIGELSRRLGKLNEAVNWFYQVVNSPDAPREPQILNQAKEQWRLAREQAEHASNAAPGAAASPREEPAASEPPTPPEAPAVPVPRAKVPTAISLYRDQVDWARRVANLCAGHNPRFDLAAVIRAALQAFQEIEPPDLEAEDEAGLTAKLKQALTGKAV